MRGAEIPTRHEHPSGTALMKCWAGVKVSSVQPFTTRMLIFISNALQNSTGERGFGRGLQPAFKLLTHQNPVIYRRNLLICKGLFEHSSLGVPGRFDLCYLHEARHHHHHLTFVHHFAGKEPAQDYQLDTDNINEM